ncbi:teleost multiple tissue opsin 3b [Chanos chanos]|uniref:Teleost multiple tissue opsin 3b n=1 Tax=Chanos chanos TaxID=29144 RepID=A0A6J2WV64_CHACN|nr:pinopsin-like [Chanos chanos]
MLFARFQVLWTPINLILLNISVSDMLVCLFGTPLSLVANIYGRWLVGVNGCRWYGFANALFGIVSMVSLAILSYERYSTILCYTKADVSDYKKAWLSIAGCWLYSLLWTTPPLFGWSSYGPEAPGTVCSVQWNQRSAGNVSYVSCLFIFCLLLPLLIMVFCYGRILMAIHGVARFKQTSAQRRETHILVMVICMVSCYLLCWIPYGVVALLGTFGRVGMLGPMASLVPSILAKSSTVLNPIIYVLFNNQFYRCFMALVHCGSEPTSHQSLHTLQSSRAGPPRLNDSPPAPQKPTSPPDTPEWHRYSATSLGSQQRAQQRDRPNLVLVVHYTA